MAGSILITYGTRPLAQRVGKLLQGAYEVQFGSAADIPHVLLQTGKYIQLPGADTAAFEHALLRICLDSSIDVVIPLGTKEIDFLVATKQLFAEYGIAIWVPDAAYGAFDRLVNPERRLPLVVLNHGVAVAGELQEVQPDMLSPVMLSGVFARPVPMDGLALCCIAD